jgi:cell wall-associated NlpC family hydrolase
MTDTDGTPRNPGVARTLANAALAQGIKKAVTWAGGAIVSWLGWPVIIGAISVALIMIVIGAITVISALNKLSDERAQFSYQCESRLGYSVGNTAALTYVPRIATSVSAEPTTTWETTALQPSTTTMPATTTPSTPPATSATTTTAATTTPTTNPYRAMPIPNTADPETKACATAVKKGDVIGAPVRDTGTELGRRAADLAHTQIGVTATATDGDTAGPTHSSFSAANLVRYAYYQASAGRITMPRDIADQIDVGDRVDGDAISPGDLVFYNFTATGGPAAVMIATTPTLGVDASALNKPISLAVLPAGNVIIKRPTLTDTRGAPTR